MTQQNGSLLDTDMDDTTEGSEASPKGKRFRTSPRANAFDEVLALIKKLPTDGDLNETIETLLTQVEGLKSRPLLVDGMMKNYVVQGKGGELTHLKLAGTPSRSGLLANAAAVYGPYKVKSAAIFAINEGIGENDPVVFTDEE